MTELVSVLRLGHRPERDKRMTTHVGLTTRAFGGERIFLPKMDSQVEKTMVDVSRRFGGSFKVEEKRNWRGLIQDWDGDVIHLTMYGENIDDLFEKVDLKNPLIIVGAEKVPGDVYKIADYNVAVGNQPHSEVAALAVFLDRFNERHVHEDYSHPDISVLPSTRDKRVVDNSNIPSLTECYEMCNSMDEELMKHTLSVLEKSMELHSHFGGHLGLIIAGSMLHDIGRTISHEVDHGVIGGDMIRERGWDEELARVVERHVGGGISREEAADQGLPRRDLVPQTMEEKIVCHADNSSGGEERFHDLIERTISAGYEKSAERMRELRDYFEKKKERV